MGSNDYAKLGQYNYMCPICLTKVKVPDTPIRRDYRGLYVCPDCYDIQNPQETPRYKTRKPRKIFPAKEADVKVVPRSGLGLKHKFGETGLKGIGNRLGEVGHETLGKPWDET